MSESTALVVSDSTVLQQICGVNDENLLFLEKLFHAPVRVCGNEILLHTDNQIEQQQFIELLLTLNRYVQKRKTLNPHLIASMYDAVDEPVVADNLLESSVLVAGKRIYPHTVRQAEALDAMKKYDLCFLVGPAGTGKTYLAMGAALHIILSEKARKLVLTRPVVEAGERLGYLPGDMEQKITPYLHPLYDAMETLLPNQSMKKLEEQNLIEVAPLAYMRGRSLQNSCILLDEAQNTTPEQMKMFLTRIGGKSKMIITGDVTQIDLPYRQESGLVQALKVLAQTEGVSIVQFHETDIVRSSLVQNIVKAYNEFSK